MASSTCVTGKNGSTSYSMDHLQFQNSVEETGINSQLRNELQQANSKIESLQAQVDLLSQQTSKIKDLQAQDIKHQQSLNKTNSKIEDLQKQVKLINQNAIKWKTFCSLFVVVFLVIVILSVAFFIYLNLEISAVYQKQKNWQDDEFQKSIKQLKDHITSEMHCTADLSNSYPMIDQDPPTFEMTRFSYHRADSDRWTSPPVYTHHQGYKICLRVIANGSSFGKGTHVSVFIHFMRGEFDDLLKWPFRGSVLFQLLDQQGDDHKNGTVIYDDSISDSVCTRVREGEVSKGGWGHIKFVTHTELKPYLKDDMLIFQIYKVELH